MDDFAIFLFNTYAIREVWYISAVILFLSASGWCIKTIYKKVKELKREGKDVANFFLLLSAVMLVFLLLVGFAPRLYIYEDNVNIHCINIDGKGQIPMQYSTNRNIYHCNTNSEIQILSYSLDRLPIRSGSILSVAFMWEIAGNKSQVGIADMPSHIATIKVPFLKENEEARLWINVLTVVDTDEKTIMHRILRIERQYASSGWRFYNFQYGY